MNIKTLTVALVTAMTATAATAGNIIGVVKDKATGEPLIGTVVSVKELKDMWATTGLDGSFTLNKMPDEGRFTLIIKYMAYKTVEVSVDALRPYAERFDRIVLAMFGLGEYRRATKVARELVPCREQPDGLELELP